MTRPARQTVAAVTLGLAFAALAATRLSRPSRAVAPAREKEPARASAPARRPAAPTSTGGIDMRGTIGGRRLSMPIPGLDVGTLRNNFEESRGSRRHEAIDILEPRGTPILAVDDGVVKKLFLSVPGGITVYQFDPGGAYCYYYAHLERYAEGLREGQILKRGDLVGYVGTSGNAPKDVPHLHFAIYRLGPDQRWWEGTPVNPYPIFAGVETASR